jgi:tetratricopeptide (TPR) repeat protein
MPQQAAFEDDGGGNNGLLLHKPFSIDAALNYLTNNGVKRSDTELLIKKFGTIPQHLSLAVGYLKENRMEKASDLVLVEKTMVEISLDQLIKSGNSDGWILLQHLVWLDSEFTSEELLLAILDNDQAKLCKAIKSLQKLAFVSVVSIDGRKDLTIYRGIQDQIANYATNNPDISKTVPQILEAISGLLNKLLPRVESNPDKGWEVVMAYVPTVKAMFEHAASREIPLPENKEIALLNAKLGVIYEKVFADLEKSLHHKKIALVMYQSIYKVGHPNIAWSLDAVGVTYEALGEFKEGLTYQKQALVMRQALYVGDHLDIAGSLFNVGIAYHKYGNVQKALSCYERSVAMYRALNEENHYNVASSFNAMGVAHVFLGDVEKSIGCYEIAIAIYQVIHQGNHLDMARSLNNIGAALEALGRVKEALAYYERAFTMYRALHKGDHLDIARSANNVGRACETSGDAENCLVYRKKALEMYQALYEGDHLYIAKALNDIGLAYEALGDLEESINSYKRAIEMYQALGENHNEMAKSLNNMGLAYEALGEPGKGLICQEIALAIRQDLYKENNPAMIQSLGYVGLAYADLCDVGKRDLYKRCSFLYDNFIKKRGVITEDIISVKQKLQEEILNPIQWLAAKGEWSKKYSSFYDWGVVGYLDKNYLKKRLHQHQLNKAGDFKIALSLCFEAITIGIANSEERDHSCAIKFVRTYPELVSEIAREHPEYFSLESIARACLADTEYLLIAEPEALNAAQQEDEFKGQGTLGYTDNSYPEYYNSGIDRVLELRLASLAKAVVLKSQYFGEELGKAISRLSYDVSSILSDGTVQTVLAPVNLYNKHWLGLLFRNLGTIVEVTYMDPEQVAMLPGLRSELENGLSLNGYKSQLEQARLTPQSYNNCGYEVIENFVYYLTGTRATQYGAMYVHSLLVENSLLDPTEYALKIKENNELIGLLSNAEPMAINEITLFTEQVDNESFESLNEKTAPYYSIAKLKIDLHRASVWFKALDFIVDSARLAQEPSLPAFKKLAIDYAYLQAMASGVNGYSAMIAGAETLYQLQLGEYQKAFNVASSTMSAMVLPVILAMANRPYLGLAYGAFMAAVNAYGAVTNAYSFYLEVSDEGATLRSVTAYKDLAVKLAASPVQSLYDFKFEATEYKLQINALLFEREKSLAQAKVKGEFEQKVLDYIYLPMLAENYELSNDVIRGILTEEEAQSLKYKPVAISYGELGYDHCVRTEDFTRLEKTIEHYYCCNIAEQILDHVVLTSSLSLEVLESL